MNTMPFASHKTEAITFPADGTTLAFFGGGRGGVSTAWIVVWSLARSGGPQHSSWVRKRSRKTGWNLLQNVPSSPAI